MHESKTCTACGKTKPADAFATKPYGAGKRTRASRCKACQREWQAEYRRAHGDRVNENAREAYARDPSRKKASKSAYRSRHQERICTRQREKYQVLYAASPEIWHAAKSRRKHRQAVRMDALDRALSRAYRAAIRPDACGYCGAWREGDMHVDHFFPLAKGGTDHWWNLVQACGPCNRRKHVDCGTRFLLKAASVNLDELPLSRKQIISIVQSTSARISIWDGAVRSGKTLASLIAFLIALADVINSGRPGLVIIAGRTLQTIERNILAPLQDDALFAGFSVEHTPGSNVAVILGRTVHLIGAADSRAEARLRGLTACLAMADEATLMTQSFWTQLLARLSVPDSRLLATTNPDNPSHWLRKDFILRAGDLDLRHWHFTLRDNPSLTEKYIADLSAENVGLWYRRRVLGEWCASEGAVFDMFDPDRHVVDVLPVMKRWIAAGCDYGTVNSFAAEVLTLGTDRRLYFTAEWYWDSRARRFQLTDAQYSGKLREFFGSVKHPGSQLYGIRPERVVVDPSAASFIRQLHNDRHMFEGGISVMGADNGVLDGIRLMSSLIGSGRLMVHSSCKHLISQLQSYSWDETAANRGEDKPVKVEDHAVDGGRYALATTRSMWRSMIVPPETAVNYQDTFGMAL